MWVDFQQFVAMHNWDQPAAVYTLASFIHSYIHFRNENNRNEDNRAAAARLAAIAAVAARVDAVEAKLTQYLSGRAAQSDDKLVDSSTGSC
jgi:hypothetical protein